MAGLLRSYWPIRGEASGMSLKVRGAKPIDVRIGLSGLVYHDFICTSSIHELVENDWLLRAFSIAGNIQSVCSSSTQVYARRLELELGI